MTALEVGGLTLFILVLLFGTFIGCWVFFITIAIKHAPPVVPVATQNAGH